MFPFSRSAQVIIAFVAVVGTAGSAPAQTAVTACGQTVKGEAYLVGDLDCPEGTESSVLLEGGTMDLRGFTIRGGEYGVFCGKETDEIAPNGEDIYKYLRCAVMNGTLADQSVVATVGRALVLTDLTIEYDGEYGVAMGARKTVDFVNLTLDLAPGKIGMLVGGGTGKVRGSNLTITGGTIGMTFVRKVRIDGFTASGYTIAAIQGTRDVRLTAANLTGGERGVQGQTVRLVDSTISGHSDVGVQAISLLAVGSTITGNTLDLRVEKRVKLEDTTCDTSNGWGVCAND